MSPSASGNSGDRPWCSSETVVATGTGGWQQLTVKAAPAAGGTSVSVDILVSLTTSAMAQVDDVILKRL